MRWIGSVGKGNVTVVLVGLVLTGCAGSVPPPKPSDFPFHASGPQVDLHWRLTQDAEVARAEGLAERRNRDLESATLQMVGLDASGRVVSFSGPVPVSWDAVSDGEAFTVSLRPRGGEVQFTVRVQSIEYRD